MQFTIKHLCYALYFFPTIIPVRGVAWFSSQDINIFYVRLSYNEFSPYFTFYARTKSIRLKIYRCAVCTVGVRVLNT